MSQYCYACGVRHRQGCPKERKKQEAEEKKRSAEESKKTECPECGLMKIMPPGDYICSPCRIEVSPKYNLDLPETTLTKLREEDINLISPVLLRYGIGFSVTPE